MATNREQAEQSLDVVNSVLKDSQRGDSERYANAQVIATSALARAILAVADEIRSLTAATRR